MATTSKKTTTKTSSSTKDVVEDDHVKSQLWIVAGCYEAALFGFSIDLDAPTLCFNPVFMHAAAHIGPIKTVNIQPHGETFASGGTDELIKLFDLKHRVELGSLMQHEGTITKVEYHNNTHLLSASEDGTIGIWRVKDWESLMRLRGHKGPIYDLSIHHSGRVALSVGKDRNLKLWNLVSGKSAFTKKLDFDPIAVSWSPSGDSFAIAQQTKLIIYNPSGDVTRTIQAPQILLAITYVSDELIVTGGEDKILSVWDVTSGNLVGRLKGHTNRIRTLAIAKHPAKPETKYLISGSSDGYIILWDLHNLSVEDEDEEAQYSPQVLAKENTQARLTCLSVIGLSEAPKKKKNKKKNKREKEENTDKEEKPEKEPQAEVEAPKKKKVTTIALQVQQPAMKRQKKSKKN